MDEHTRLSVYSEGYSGNKASENPYWKNYPNEKGISVEEQYKACIWVDGYAQKVINSRLTF